MPPPAARNSPSDGPWRLRLTGAVTFSLLVHAFVVSLQFGIPGMALPALELPWRERRAQAVDLSVVLAPPAARPAAEPPALPAEAPAPPPAGMRLVPAPVTPKSVPARPAKPRAAARPPRPRAKRETPVIALNERRDDSFNMPAPAVDEILPLPEPEAEVPPAPVAAPETAVADEPKAEVREPAVAAPAGEEGLQQAREAEERELRRQEEEASRQRALALEAQRIEEEARRAEAERLARDQEARRQAEEANRRAEALALQQREREREAADAAARQALELEERQRTEALRLQAERMQREAAELQARKLAEAAAAREREQEQKQAAELAVRRKAEAEAAHAANSTRTPELVLGDNPAPGARIDALPRGLGGGLAGRALEQARRGDALRNDAPTSRQADNSTAPPRRHSLLGSRDADVGVMMYVEGWRLKIERNGSVMYPRAAVDKAHGDPVVTVAVRSDGSVEEVVIHRSSGRPELDEAVHRIVRVNARFSAFPPELARRFDVIEIRRVWNFDDRLRILEEVR